MKNTSTIKDVYRNYLWEKCSLSVFYRRIREWLSPFEAVKKPAKVEFGVRSKLYAEQLNRYKQQKEPKSSRNVFYARVQKWRPKEEAILIDPPKHERKKFVYRTTRVAYESKEQRVDPSDSEIRITYHSDEAKVIADEYERLIETLEEQRNNTENPVEASNLRDRITKLNEEYKIFLSYNPKQNESM